jgi:hypothetical protein
MLSQERTSACPLGEQEHVGENRIDRFVRCAGETPSSRSCESSGSSKPLLNSSRVVPGSRLIIGIVKCRFRANTERHSGHFDALDDSMFLPQKERRHPDECAQA